MCRLGRRSRISAGGWAFASVGRGLGCLRPGNRLGGWPAGGEVAQAIFMFAQTPVSGLGLSRSWSWHRDRERPTHDTAVLAKAHLAPACVTMQTEERTPGGDWPTTGWDS